MPGWRRVDDDAFVEYYEHDTARWDYDRNAPAWCGLHRRFERWLIATPDGTASLPDGPGAMEASMRLATLPAHSGTRDPDALHPFGRCTCLGEGSCQWCVLTDRHIKDQEKIATLEARIRELEKT